MAASGLHRTGTGVEPAGRDSEPAGRISLPPKSRRCWCGAAGGMAGQQHGSRQKKTPGADSSRLQVCSASYAAYSPLGGSAMGLSARECPDCHRRLRTTFKKTVTGREVCPDCANALSTGSAAGVITENGGFGYGIWAMLMRKIRRSG